MAHSSENGNNEENDEIAIIRQISAKVKIVEQTVKCYELERNQTRPPYQGNGIQSQP